MAEQVWRTWWLEDEGDDCQHDLRAHTDTEEMKKARDLNMTSASAFSDGLAIIECDGRIISIHDHIGKLINPKKWPGKYRELRNKVQFPD